MGIVLCADTLLMMGDRCHNLPKFHPRAISCRVETVLTGKKDSISWPSTWRWPTIRTTQCVGKMLGPQVLNGDGLPRAEEPLSVSAGSVLGLGALVDNITQLRRVGKCEYKMGQLCKYECVMV